LIDIHSHLLFGIDDGAKNMAEALSLLRLAANDGIERLVLTPHLHFGRFNNTQESIYDQFLVLRQAASDEAITIQLAVAAEVRFDSAILSLLVSKQLPMYGKFEGQRYFLLELPHSHIPMGCIELITYLKKQNITPVIAHPERNRDLLAAPEKIYQLARLGCWFQLTAGAITGHFGENCQNLSLLYLEQGFAHVVASDAHNIKRRPPNLSEARVKVVNLLGEAKAQELFWTNPFNITETMFKNIV
jgi:protein-tyrosine phosphatase